MDMMRELYDKVARDIKLRAEFAEIIGQYQNNPDELKEKLLGFAKRMGYSVKYEDMQSFFSRIAERPESQLSEEELDAVAGGKSDADNNHIYKSIATLGGYCAGYSMTHC